MVFKYSFVEKIPFIFFIGFMMFLFCKFLSLPESEMPHTFSYYFVLVLFSPLSWKMFAVPFIYLIRIDKNVVAFGRWYGSDRVTSTDVVEWGIKKTKATGRYSSRPGKYLVAKLKSGKQVAYQLKILPYKEYNLLIESLSQAWGKKPKDYGYAKIFKDEMLYLKTSVLL